MIRLLAAVLVLVVACDAQARCPRHAARKAARHLVPRVATLPPRLAILPLFKAAPCPGGVCPVR